MFDFICGQICFLKHYPPIIFHRLTKSKRFAVISVLNRSFTMATEKPCDISERSGMIVFRHLSPTDLELECDTAIVELPSLIREMADRFGLRDLAVKLARELFCAGDRV